MERERGVYKPVRVDLRCIAEVRDIIINDTGWHVVNSLNWGKYGSSNIEAVRWAYEFIYPLAIRASIFDLPLEMAIENSNLWEDRIIHMCPASHKLKVDDKHWLMMKKEVISAREAWVLRDYLLTKAPEMMILLLIKRGVIDTESIEGIFSDFYSNNQLMLIAGEEISRSLFSPHPVFRILDRYL